MMEAPTPTPRVLLTCDRDQSHEGEHHSIARSGGSQQIEMSWTDAQALKG
jgi:hypothetical protein